MMKPNDTEDDVWKEFANLLRDLILKYGPDLLDEIEEEPDDQDKAN